MQWYSLLVLEGHSPAGFIGNFKFARAIDLEISDNLDQLDPVALQDQAFVLLMTCITVYLPKIVWSRNTIYSSLNCRPSTNYNSNRVNYMKSFSYSPPLHSDVAWTYAARNICLSCIWSWTPYFKDQIIKLRIRDVAEAGVCKKPQTLTVSVYGACSNRQKSCNGSPGKSKITKVFQKVPRYLIPESINTFYFKLIS